MQKDEQIINDAQLEANRIIEEAKQKAKEMVKESYILKEIQKEADKLKEKVVSDCKK